MHFALSPNAAPSPNEAMPRTQPPFRADHVDSLLRSHALKDARVRHAACAIHDAELEAIEDQEISWKWRRRSGVNREVAMLQNIPDHMIVRGQRPRGRSSSY